MSQTQSNPVTRGINHVGLTVPDLDAATQFFVTGLGAKFAYDGLTENDAAREGETVERQLGLSSGTKIIKQRLLRIGNSANLELFEIISLDQAAPARLQDAGWNHISFYVDDIESAIAAVTDAGGTFLSEVHDNSRHEDTEGNGSVYFETPWGSLIELQTIPNGYYYPENSETESWLPAFG